MPGELRSCSWRPCSHEPRRGLRSGAVCGYHAPMRSAEIGLRSSLSSTLQQGSDEPFGEPSSGAVCGGRATDVPVNGSCTLCHMTAKCPRHDGKLPCVPGMT
eukprot:10597109-Alexandrium_andersonii.AAC.1